MNFMKYPTKNDISISNAVLKLAKLQNAERLELTAATGAVIVTSGRMTVKELLSTVQSVSYTHLPEGQRKVMNVLDALIAELK